MDLEVYERPSESPLVDFIYHSRSEEVGSFTSLAECHWEMVITHHEGRSVLTVRGPESAASPSPIPAPAEFLGIVFKLGTFMPHMPGLAIADKEIELPDASGHTFYLHGESWEFPNLENADVFVERLIRQELVVFDSVIDTALQDQPQSLSARSIERRFRQVTGLTQGRVRQIMRARHALTLLQEGLPIFDVVDLAGYADQPHLTRALRHYTGETPAQVLREAVPG